MTPIATPKPGMLPRLFCCQLTRFAPKHAKARAHTRTLPLSLLYHSLTHTLSLSHAVTHTVTHTSLTPSLLPGVRSLFEYGLIDCEDGFGVETERKENGYGDWSCNNMDKVENSKGSLHWTPKSNYTDVEVVKS